MWFLITLANASIHIRIRGISLTIRKRAAVGVGVGEPKSNSRETARWFSSWAFYHLSSDIPGASIWEHKLQQGSKRPPPQLLLSAVSVNEIEHGRRGSFALLFSLDWLTLINSGKWFQMIPVKLDLTAWCLLFHPAQGLSLWHLPLRKVTKSNSTGRFSMSFALTVFCVNED